MGSGKWDGGLAGYENQVITAKLASAMILWIGRMREMSFTPRSIWREVGSMAWTYEWSFRGWPGFSISSVNQASSWFGMKSKQAMTYYSSLRMNGAWMMIPDVDISLFLIHIFFLFACNLAFLSGLVNACSGWISLIDWFLKRVAGWISNRINHGRLNFSFLQEILWVPCSNR